jgi:hypothetical protein
MASKKNKRNQKEVAPKEELLEIFWKDISSYGGWNPRDDSPQADCLVARSCGYLVSEDKEVIRIAQSLISRNNMLGELLVIPKAVIVSRKKK